MMLCRSNIKLFSRWILCHHGVVLSIDNYCIEVSFSQVQSVGLLVLGLLLLLSSSCRFALLCFVLSHIRTGLVVCNMFYDYEDSHVVVLCKSLPLFMKHVLNVCRTSN